MGKITGRVLGNVAGRLGYVIMSKWKKIYVVKSLYTLKPKNKDAKQLPQVTKLKLMSGFLTHFRESIKLGFFKRNNKITEWALAIKYNLAHALVGSETDFQINYKNIKFSNGNLEGAWASKIKFESKQITCSWQMAEHANKKLIGRDTAHILLYDVSKGTALNHKVFAERSDLEWTVTLNEGYIGHFIHAWIFFVSPDGKSVSNTDYIGSGTTIA
jgi:hypothetical protein